MVDYETRHYVFVGPDGTLGLSLRWTGDIPDIHYPIQMLNEHQCGIPQPYADPPYKQRGGPYQLHTNMWFMSLRQPQAFFRRFPIPAENFEEASTDPHCKWYNFGAGRVELRPGHCYVGVGCHAGPAYRNLVELSHYAYGGKPIYYVQREARLHEWEIAELMQHGLLHPAIYKPEGARDAQQARQRNMVGPYRVPRIDRHGRGIPRIAEQPRRVLGQGGHPHGLLLIGGTETHRGS